MNVRETKEAMRPQWLGTSPGNRLISCEKSKGSWRGSKGCHLLRRSLFFSSLLLTDTDGALVAANISLVFQLLLLMLVGTRNCASSTSIARR